MDKLSILFDIGYIISPLIGFIPQIYTGNITYDPLLSILTATTNILKIFPAKGNEIDKRMTYQFIICTLLHIYLLNRRKSILKNKSSTQNILDEAVLIRKIGNFISLYILLFITFLKTIDFLGFSSTFIKFSIMIDVLIASLHVKYYVNTENKPRELFLTWIIGDLLRIVLMVAKYKSPIECFVGVLIQIVINLYVLIK